MSQTDHTNRGMSVSILDKEFIVACPPDMEESLRSAAHFLDAQMRQIREMGRVIGTERIAVMAALNISHQFLMMKNDPKTEVTEVADDLKERLHSLSQKMDTVLNEKPAVPRYEDAF
jgi:cell division protein ZapA